MPRYFSIKPSLSLRGRKFKGIRGLSGKPFHPPLTDIPVAAYFLAAIADIVSFIAYNKDRADIADDFYVTGTFLLIAGGVVSVPTIATGFWDWLKSTPNRTQAWRTANWHAALMLATTFLVAFDLWLRLAFWGADARFVDTTILIFSLLAGITVSFGALYGGTMVYEFAFNVEQDVDHAYTESEVDRYPGQEEKAEASSED